MAVLEVPCEYLFEGDSFSYKNNIYNNHFIKVSRVVSQAQVLY